MPSLHLAGYARRKVVISAVNLANGMEADGNEVRVLALCGSLPFCCGECVLP